MVPRGGRPTSSGPTSGLSQPWAAGATFIPVVAHYRDAAVDISRVAADGADTVADALAEVDLDSLRTVDGRIDLDALDALEEPLTHVRNSLVDLKAVTDESRSPWFVHRVDFELDDFDDSVDEHLPGIENALSAIRLAPELLGADGPRRYLVLFTTPSESRGLGGFVGNYAELTADDGRLTMTRFGRAQDLDRAAEEAGARVHGHEEFLAQYGRFGFDTDGSGKVGDAAFRNLAMTPNFPWVGEIAADLYAQTTGRRSTGRWQWTRTSSPGSSSTPARCSSRPSTSCSRATRRHRSCCAISTCSAHRRHEAYRRPRRGRPAHVRLPARRRAARSDHTRPGPRPARRRAAAADVDRQSRGAGTPRAGPHGRARSRRSTAPTAGR